MVDIHLTTGSAHDGFPWETVNALAPHLLWLLFIVGVLFWLGRDRLDAIAARITKISVAGVDLELAQTLKQAAVDKGTPVSAIELGRTGRRLASSKTVVMGAQILWIDDVPENNRFERAVFEEAGASIIVARSSEQARISIGQSAIDLVISDIDRNGDRTAGLEFAATLADEGRRIPVVFYVRAVTGPVPYGAVGITDSPDELVHLALDALARRRG